jgi:hypothetical protein
MNPKKYNKASLSLEERLIRTIAASKNKTIVNVSYETIGNVTVININ